MISDYYKQLSEHVGRVRTSATAREEDAVQAIIDNKENT